MQRYGSASWSGDINNTFDVFAAQAPLGLSTALSGIPYWGTDIGGFFHTVPESPELFARWFAFGAFCPLFRAHGRGPGLRGWREHLPWAHGPEVESVCRKFAELRARLLPYNYTIARQAHERGMPLMRPLVLEYPDDPNVVGMADEYLWGPGFLVAPVTRGGATRWPVYLPAGDWHDYWTGETHAGGRWVEVAAPLDRIPLFVRAGAIVPLGPVRQHDADARGDASLELLAYPDGDSSFTLYEDDGETLGYERGEFALTEVTCRRTDAGVRLAMSAPRGDYRGRPASRAISFRIRLERAPRAVSVAGRPALPRLATAPGSGEPGWWHADGFVLLGPLAADSGLVISIDA
jgi:alpha-glucosidase (family GH31 glycosyl hydrolase)